MRWRFTLNPDTDNLVISEPIGWEEVELAIVRSKEWHGVFAEYSLDLEFYDDPQITANTAYTYLKDEYDLNGVEGFVILQVEMACDDDDAFAVQGQWRLNFTSYQQENGAYCLIKLNMEPENYLMTFKNRYDQKVDLDTAESFDGTALTPYTELGLPLTINPKAVPVTSDLEWAGTAEDNDFVQTDIIVAGAGTSNLQSLGYYQLGYNVVNLDEIATRIELVSEWHLSSPLVSPTWVIINPGDYTFTFVNFSFTVNASIDSDGQDNTACGNPNVYDDLSVELYLVMGGTTTLVDSGTLTSCLDGSDVISINVTGDDFTASLIAGDEVKLYVRVQTDGEFDRDLLTQHDAVWTTNFNQTTRNVTLFAHEFLPATTARGFAINETFSRIIEAITDDGFRFLSNYFGRTDSEPYTAPAGIDGCGSLREFTTGLMLREYSEATIKMSMKDAFEGVNAIDNMGIGLEDDATRAGFQVVRGEPMEYFYDSTVLVQLDKVPEVVINVMPDEHYSIFRFGYQKWEAEEYTGLDEFATKREYRTTLTSVKNTLDKISQLVASGYAIELTRRRTFDPVTKEDWRFDDDIFIICCKRNAGDIVVEQGNITADANLIDPDSVYNFRISPARNAMRWLKTVLNSYKDPEAVGSTIEFTSGDGNFIAEGLMTGGCPEENATIAENDSLSVANAADPADARPVYMPETWEFEYPLSFTQYNLIKANPKATIQARFLQDTSFRDFYIREIRYKPNDGIANWILLPQRGYPINDCRFYIIQSRGTGYNVFGSIALIGAQIENLFVFVNGNLMKYNDAVAANNEIDSWDDTTGYGTLSFNVPVGQQISILHIPPSGGHCSVCVHRFEGRGSGNKVPVLTGFGLVGLSQMYVFYNGRLMKYSDLVAANNEITSYVGGTEALTFNANTNVNRELRVFGFVQPCCSDMFNSHGDGTDTLALSGIGDANLSNLFIFYNGNLGKYNDSNVANNEVLSYDPGTQEATFAINLHPDRELRALNIENCE